MTDLITDEMAEDLKLPLTQALRRPNGTQMLLLSQVKAFWSLNQTQDTGAVIYGRVGMGKMLAGMLFPLVPERMPQRPVLFTLGGLVKETEAAFREYTKHWKFAPHLQVHSFDRLSNRKFHKWLKTFRPDMLIVDEGHALAAVETSARARRFDQYVAGYDETGKPDPEGMPECIVIVMTGSPETSSFLDYSHFFAWCLKGRNPFPNDRRQQALIADVIDDPGSELADRKFEKLRRQLPRLFGACSTPADCREVVAHVMHNTLGIFVTTDSFVGAKLHIHPIVADSCPVLDENMARLRNLYEMPDGWALSDASETGDAAEANGKPAQADEATKRVGAWQAERQMSLGFYHALKPRPPKPYLKARREYAACIRAGVRNGIGMSEAQVRERLEEARDSKYLLVSRAWESAQAGFPEVRVVEWFSDAVLQQAAAWGREHGGGSIIWVEYPEFGETLAELTGWTYYGRKGKSKIGTFVEHDPGTQPIIVGIQANSTGRNLQFKWHLNLVVGVPSSGKAWEQLMGREMRLMQAKKHVWFYYLLGCRAHVNSMDRAIVTAQASEAKNRMPMLLLHHEYKGPPPYSKLPDRPGFRLAEQTPTPIQTKTELEQKEITNGRLRSTQQKQDGRKQSAGWLAAVSKARSGKAGGQ
jgi:hypothetical protein